MRSMEVEIMAICRLVLEKLEETQKLLTVATKKKILDHLSPKSRRCQVAQSYNSIKHMNMRCMFGCNRLYKTKIGRERFYRLATYQIYAVLPPYKCQNFLLKSGSVASAICTVKFSKFLVPVKEIRCLDIFWELCN